MGESNAKFSVILPAAGSGRRFGGGDKLMVQMGGMSVLQRSVRAFARRADVAEIVVVTGRDRFAEYGAHLREAVAGRGDGFLRFVEGGRERWESVLFGLRAAGNQVGYVAVHDAARPLVSDAVIDAAFAGAVNVGGSVPVVAEPATLKRVDADGRVTETVSRLGLYQAQTPQCFAREKLLHAYEELLRRGELDGVTDDAQVFEKMGWPVAGTAGAATNMKITTAEDVAVAEAILRASERVGRFDQV